MVKDWRSLEVGKFYRLQCGCEGQIVLMREEGFVLAYSKGLVHSDPYSFEESYSKGNGPYINFFTDSLQDLAMPAEPMEPPDWWERSETLKSRLAELIDDLTERE